MNIDIIIFAIIALVIAYRIYNILGVVDSEESASATGAKIVDLNGDDYQIVDKDEENDLEEAVVEKLTAKNLTNLSKIKKIDQNFLISKFAKNAETAFEMIIKAFTSGDQKTLEILVDDKERAKFTAEFQKQKDLGQSLNIDIISIVALVVDDITLTKNIATITVKITSEQISSVTNKKGEIIAGDKDKIEEIEDLWSFSKDVSSSDPVWRLVKTSN